MSRSISLKPYFLTFVRPINSIPRQFFPLLRQPVTTSKTAVSRFASMAEKSPEVTKTSSGITTISLDREHRRNAVDPSTARKLYDAFLEYEKDSTQKVCVFHGKHGIFCAGFDLHALSKSGKDEKAVISKDHQVKGRNQGPMGPSRLQIKKPVITSVAGHAVAGGLELSLLGDIRVAEESAIFGVFCRRWGIPLIDGGCVRLPAIIGLGRALDMVLTGRPVDAKEAHLMGLANRVVPEGKGLEEATKIAESLLQFPQMCMNVDRDNCYYSVYNATSFEDALSHEFDQGAKVLEIESIKGATKFSKGSGRHGSFQL